MWTDVLKEDKPSQIQVGLIKGRHPMPVDEYVWDKPMEGGMEHNLSILKGEAMKYLEGRIGKEIHLHITGYTAAVTGFLKAWNATDNPKGKLLLYHYDIDTKSYWSEEYS